MEYKQSYSSGIILAMLGEDGMKEFHNRYVATPRMGSSHVTDEDKAIAEAVRSSTISLVAKQNGVSYSKVHSTVKKVALAAYMGR